MCEEQINNQETVSTMCEEQINNQETNNFIENTFNLMDEEYNIDLCKFPELFNAVLKSEELFNSFLFSLTSDITDIKCKDFVTITSKNLRLLYLEEGMYAGTNYCANILSFLVIRGIYNNLCCKEYINLFPMDKNDLITGCCIVRSEEENKATISLEKTWLSCKMEKLLSDFNISNVYNMSDLLTLVDNLSLQVAIEIDRKVLEKLYETTDKNTKFTYDSNVYKVPGILPIISESSALIYQDTLMGEGNIILINPTNIQVLEKECELEYEISMYKNYVTGRICEGKWKVISSSIFPKDKIIVLYNDENPVKCNAYFGIYTPFFITSSVDFIISSVYKSEREKFACEINLF